LTNKHTMSTTEEIAAVAARLVVEEGMEYASAKRKAARDFGHRPALPSNEEVEDAVREHIELFCADTQAAELRALREVALIWMQRLAEFRPHLSGAAWHVASLNRPGREPLNVLIVSERSARLGQAGEPVTLHLMLHDLDDQRGALKPDARGRSWRGDLAALQSLLQAEP
jgi:hypothetical protein